MPKIKPGTENLIEKEDDIYIHWVCPNCQSEDIEENPSAGDLECTNCGRIVGERIIRTDKEWREFQDDSSSKSKSRVGGPENPLLGNSSLSTMIEPTLTGKNLSKSQTRISLSGKESGLRAGFKKIDEMASTMQLVQLVKDKAKEIFKDMEEKKAIKGRNSEALIAACIYIGCRQNEMTRSWKEIEKYVSQKTTRKQIQQCYSWICKTLNLQMDIVEHKNYTTLWVNRLSLPIKVATISEQVAKKAVELGIVSGRAPTTVAASAIYFVLNDVPQFSNEKVGIKEIVDVSGVSEATIKNCYKELSAEQENRQNLLK